MSRNTSFSSIRALKVGAGLEGLAVWGFTGFRVLGLQGLL